MVRERAFVVLLAVFCLAVGVMSGLAMAFRDVTPGNPPTVRVTDVDCPTEDSCLIDYRNDYWHVTEGTP